MEISKPDILRKQTGLVSFKTLRRIPPPSKQRCGPDLSSLQNQLQGRVPSQSSSSPLKAPYQERGAKCWPRSQMKQGGIGIAIAMDPSIMKLLEDDEDETMHSGVDVEAFQAALNRDIGGSASTSGSDPVSAVLSQGSNNTFSQPMPVANS
ncbi:hypothetical protein PIB30_087705 [Stylosanthes scabra]|uniref:Uncharacterized protein n=1 Tax=Stylosanthes scabra TaxID=79078 RepID=A0ABU6ZSA2_9FABA|nr:hypothetical protein [Stylosanthes scabra]